MIKFKQFIKEELTPLSGTQYGSNPGGVHIDNDGNKFYVKHYRDADQAKVEALTGKIYQHMGIHTVNPDFRHVNGNPSVVTPWNDHLTQMRPREFENVSPRQAHQLGTMYHAAVLTKNWDIVGLEHDNIVKHRGTHDFHAVDHGGSFHFRARGSAKDYGPDIAEHESLRNPDNPSGHVFNHVFKTYPEVEKQSLENVRNMDDDHVEHLFRTSGLHNWQELHSNFMQRKTALLQKYGN